MADKPVESTWKLLRSSITMWNPEARSMVSYSSTGRSIVTMPDVLAAKHNSAHDTPILERIVERINWSMLDDMTVRDASSIFVDITPRELSRALVYEEGHKNRPTMVKSIADHLEVGGPSTSKPVKKPRPKGK